MENEEEKIRNLWVEAKAMDRTSEALKMSPKERIIILATKHAELLKIQAELRTGLVFHGGKSGTYTQTLAGYPSQLLEFKSATKTVHPTQKPVALMEYMIRTYTDEGATVLDFTMGSGTTGVAAKKLNRNFVGVEKNAKCFKIAKARIEATDRDKLPILKTGETASVRPK